MFTSETAVGPQSVTLQLRDGSPTGTTMATSSAVVPDRAGAWIDFEFSPPVNLTPGSIVYLYAEVQDRVAWAVSDHDAYAAGEPYGQCIPAAEPFPLAPAIGDFTFITYQPGPPDDPTDPTDPIDPVATAVADLPLTAFRAPGHQTAIQSRLADIAEKISDGDAAGAIRDLQNLRRHDDGCADAAGTADRNDWITDCAAQLEIRALIDGLIADLGG